MNREKLGTFTSAIGVLSNVLLAGVKIVVGLLFGAISVLADGLNNLTDTFSSALSLVSFKLSSKPADKDHPFGHERTEYVLAMVISFLILLVAFELIKESFAKILRPSSMNFSWLVIIILGISIIGKLLLFFLNITVSKKIKSDVLKASAFDSLGDCISTSVILVTLLLSRVITFNLDGYAGVLVSLIIAFSGIKVLKETFSKLIGQAPESKLVEDIKNLVCSFDGVLGIHDLNVYSYGPSKFFASVHVEVDARADFMSSHELVDNIEREVYNKLNIILTGHLDPIEVDNPEVDEIKGKINKMLLEIDSSFSMHDFRVVKGHDFTNLIFDVAVPYENRLTEEQIISELQNKVDLLETKYYLVVTVEYQTL